MTKRISAKRTWQQKHTITTTAVKACMAVAVMLATALSAPSPAWAAISDTTPSDGETVTVNTNPPNPTSNRIYELGADNVTVNVLNGAKINYTGTYAIGLGQNGIVNNAGTITAAGFYGLKFSGNGEVVNSGTVKADGTAILFSSSVSSSDHLTLEPGSKIIGSVAASDGTDTFTLGGSSGSDTFNVSDIGVHDVQYYGFEVFTKEGNSTWTLTGSGSQDWIVNGGTLVGDTDSLQGDITNNAEVVFNQNTSGTYAGVISGFGSLTKKGAGTLVLSGNNTYTGGTTISGGTLRLGGGERLADSGDVMVKSGVTFDLGDHNETIAGLFGSGDVTLGAGGLTVSKGDFSGVISGSSGLLTKTGTGTLVLAGNNTYTGGTVVKNGTLKAKDGTAFVDNTAYRVNGGTLDLNGHDLTMSKLSGSGGTIDMGGGADLTVDQSSNTTYSGGITGSGSLTKSGTGTLVLAGDSSVFGGSTTVSAGTLLINGKLGGQVTVDSGATLAGTGRIGGNATVNGTLSAGNSPGVITIAGDLTMSNTTVSKFQLTAPNVVDTTNPTPNDLVVVGGNLTLDGTLNAHVASAGYYRLFQYGGTVSGGFDTENVTSTTSGFTVTSHDILVNTSAKNISLIARGSGQFIQFWDGSNQVSGGIVQGGKGTWNSTNTNWTSSQGHVNDKWRGSVGVFGGKKAGGNVTVVGTQSFDTLQFKKNGYVLTGGRLALDPATNPYGAINVDGGVTAEIGSEITDGSASKLAKVGGGTLVLAGANTYSGGTTIHGGTLKVTGAINHSNADMIVGGNNGDDAALVIANGGTVISDNGIIGTSGATGMVTVTGKESEWNNSFGLGVGYGGDGTLNITDGGKVKSKYGFIGDLPDSTGSVIVEGGNSKWINDIHLTVGEEGTGTLTIARGGTVSVVSGNSTVHVAHVSGSEGTLNIGAAPGQTAVAPGMLDAAKVKFGNGTGELNFNHTGASYTFAPGIAGDGRVNVYSGTTILTGNSSAFTGDTTVLSGALIVGSSAGSGAVLGGDVSVAAQGILGGHGTIGGTVNNAGTVAPGNSIGTLTINGDYVAQPGSVYTVEVNAQGQHDKIDVHGKARLNGGRVDVQAAQGNYQPQTHYTILSADGGVTGQFASVTSNLAFLDPSLGYASSAVTLTLTRNDTHFTSVAKTPNQYAVASSVADLGLGSTLYKSIVPLDASSARDAYDALSAEFYASRQSALLTDSAHLRQAVSHRLARSCVSTRVGDASAPAKAKLCAGTAWLYAYGDWGHFDGDGNAARLDHNASGVFIGADMPLSEHVRVGFVAGYGHSEADVGGYRDSHGSDDSLHLGLYAGMNNGPLSLKAGVAHAWHALDSQRTIHYHGFTDNATASYDARSTQVFAQGGYTFDLDVARLTPFIRGAYVHLHTEGFSEDGGAAALTAESSSNDIGTSLVGVRLNRELQVLNGTDIHLHGMLGWQHRYGDTTPETTLAFDGGAPFTVSGAPMARNALAIQAGMDANVTDNLTLGASYVGRVGDGTQANGVRGDLTWYF